MDAVLQINGNVCCLWEICNFDVFHWRNVKIVLKLRERQLRPPAKLLFDKQIR